MNAKIPQLKRDRSLPNRQGLLRLQWLLMET